MGLQKCCRHGVFAVNEDDGYPYAIPSIISMAERMGLYYE